MPHRDSGEEVERPVWTGSVQGSWGHMCAGLREARHTVGALVFSPPFLLGILCGINGHAVCRLRGPRVRVLPGPTPGRLLSPHLPEAVSETIRVAVASDVPSAQASGSGGRQAQPSRRWTPEPPTDRVAAACTCPCVAVREALGVEGSPGPAGGNCILSAVSSSPTCLRLPWQHAWQSGRRPQAPHSLAWRLPELFAGLSLKLVPLPAPPHPRTATVVVGFHHHAGFCSCS